MKTTTELKAAGFRVVRIGERFALRLPDGSTSAPNFVNAKSAWSRARWLSK